jgi:hypothetical protein
MVHFDLLMRRMAFAVYSKFVWWLAEIVLSHLMRWIRRALNACRPLWVRSANRLRRAWEATKQIRNLSLVNMESGEILFGA